VLGVASLDEWTKGNQPEAHRLARRGLETAKDEESRFWCHSAMSLVCLSSGAFADAVTHAVEAAERSARPSDRLSIGALAALYGGNAETARELNDRVGAASTNPSMQALYEYVAGEIDSATGNSEGAEAHYARAIELSRASGGTFGAAIASVGLLTMQAEAGRTGDALRGYLEVIDYFERSGFWTPLWTTLRNLAQLLGALGSQEPALFILVAAAHAPEASAMSDDAITQASGAIDQDTAARIRAEASAGTRARVLEVARESIDRHLTAVRR
jgi:tetratricopeptide (TPR) repeat protein